MDKTDSHELHNYDELKTKERSQSTCNQQHWPKSILIGGSRIINISKTRK